MLKKIALVTLFVVTAVVGASSAFAGSATKVPTAPVPQGFCVPFPMPGC
ncbi:MAG TPA: hypothetical protein VHO06_13485 [Polyangia bacterium]|nr:hypothetical protein [Polyangia bacterium]